MSWLFSLGLVEECLEQANLAYPLFVQLKSMSIASRSCQHGKKTVVFHGFPSLQMSSNLTADRGAGLLILSLVDFLAKRSQQRPEDAMWRTICGPKCTEWLRR